MNKVTAAALLLLTLFLTISLFSSCRYDDESYIDTESGESTAESAETTGTKLKSSLADLKSLDLDCNAVTGDIFAENKLTMVRVWCTQCPNCLGGMLDLADLSDEYADKDVAIMGIIYDVFSTKDDDEVLEINADYARLIIKEAGVKFTNVVRTLSLFYLMPDIKELPTTFFVDKNGEIIATYLGEKTYKQWARIIEFCLDAVD